MFENCANKSPASFLKSPFSPAFPSATTPEAGSPTPFRTLSTSCFLSIARDNACLIFIFFNTGFERLNPK